MLVNEVVLYFWMWRMRGCREESWITLRSLIITGLELHWVPFVYEGRPTEWLFGGGWCTEERERAYGLVYLVVNLEEYVLFSQYGGRQCRAR